MEGSEFKDMGKTHRSTLRMGIQVPEHINFQVEKLTSALAECLPYQSQGHPENEGLIDTALTVGKELVRYITEIKANPYI